MSTQFQDFDSKCKGTLEHFKRELGKVRTGRASTSVLENIQVDYYGSHVSLLQLALVNSPEPRLMTVQVYDPQAVDAVEKAILSSDLGFNPSRDGSLLRIMVPPLTQERRKELGKKIHKMGEEVKITLRGLRREAVDLVKKREKAKEIGQDDVHKASDEIQKITDKHTSEVDVVVNAKEKEIMEV
jgi:ribosome recycling factor